MAINPRDAAMELEARADLPDVQDSELARGLAVPALPFRSGHLLAMRRFPATRPGSGYTSIWHMDPDGRLAIYQDQQPQYSCPRAFGPSVDEAVVVPIDIDWPTPHQCVMDIDDGETRIHWAMHLSRSRGSRIADGLGSLMPARLRRSRWVLKAAGLLARPLFGAGKMRLEGTTPSRQEFRADLQRTWLIDRSQATVNGVDLGEPGPLPRQRHLGDFWFPQRGIFAIADGFFTPHDPERHYLVATRHELARQPRL